MLPPSANFSHLPDAFKAKITSLIQEQLKPIVTELAVQQQTLLNNLALLKHNHNVNDYQTTRLEAIRDLEQSVNFKVSGVLGFDPWQHPTMGTNLREPVPADPELVPKFTPVDQVTHAEHATQSAALIKEAGMSARRIGVPLTFQDFPDHPSMNSSAKKEDPMHASIPLFGLRAPRWRAKQGLDDHAIPGTAAYNGVVAPPVGRTGLKLYSNRVRELKVPMWKLAAQGVDRFGIGATSSSSSPGAGTSNSPGVQGGGPASATPSNTRTPLMRRPTVIFPSSSSKAPPARPRPLYRTYAIADMEDSIRALNPTSASNRVPKPSALRRTSTMTTIGSTTSITSETSTHSSFSRISTTATIGSEPEPRPSSPRKAKVTTTKTKTKAKQSTSKQRSKRTNTKTAAAPAPTSSTSTSTSTPTSSSTITERPKLKRGRQTAELEDTADSFQDREEDREEAEPAHKRRKRSVVPSDTSASSQSTTRRSTRVTRASTAAATGTNTEVPQPRPAPRGRATKGKKGNKRS